jgi:hypothetical protein
MFGHRYRGRERLRKDHSTKVEDWKRCISELWAVKIAVSDLIQEAGEKNAQETPGDH